jgi:hypothetical protein
MEDRAIEFVDHLHEHFVDPVCIRDGRYRAPTTPGFSAEMHRDSLSSYQFPHGKAWQEERAATGASYNIQRPRRPGKEIFMLCTMAPGPTKVGIFAPAR